MNKDLFKIIYKGTLKDGFNAQSVATKLVHKFKITHEKALHIIKAGQEVTLNKNIPHLKAYQFKTALEDIGMCIRLERFSVTVKKNLNKPEQLPSTQEQENPETPDKNIQYDQKAKASDDSSGWSIDSTEHTSGNTEDIHNNHIEPVVHPIDHNEKADKNTEISISDDNLFEKIKSVGGWVLGIFGGLFILIKKFGLFKLLKIGVVMAAASAIGFNPEEACMGNGQCESDVDDQMDACWEGNGFDKIDWDNISAEEYLALKPKIENEFIACFIYFDDGERIFNSPIDLRLDLMEFCQESEIKNMALHKSPVS